MRVTALLITLVLSGIFFETRGNPWGILYFQEVVITVGIFASIVFILREQVTNGATPVYLIVVFFACFVYSLNASLIAYVQHGQPLLYGFIEERKVWTMLAAFIPFALLPRKQSLQLAHNGVSIGMGSFIIIGMIFLSYLSVVPPINQDYRISANSIVGSKILTAVGFLGISTAYHLTFAKKSKQKLVLIAMGLLALIFAVKSRQVIVAVFLTILILLLPSIRMVISTRIRRHGLLRVLVVLLMLTILIYGAYLSGIIGIYLNSLENIGDSWRASTMAHMMDNWRILGNGSLSLMWDGGYHRLYGPTFYSVDVGLIGGFFEGGIIALAVNIGMVAYIWALSKEISTESRQFNYTVLMYTIAISALSEPVAVNSHLLGIALVIITNERIKNRARLSVHNKQNKALVNG